MIARLLFFLLIAFLFAKAHPQDSQLMDTLNLVVFSIDAADLEIKLPNGFQRNPEKKNEFFHRKNGIVIQYYLIEGIPASQYCDSLGTDYLLYQKLTNLQQYHISNTSVFKGTFFIGQIEYIRAFLVYPVQSSTLLIMANYPKAFDGKLEKNIGLKHRDCGKSE